MTNLASRSDGDRREECVGKVTLRSTHFWPADMTYLERELRVFVKLNWDHAVQVEPNVPLSQP